jgi:hypothetical protein
MTRDIISLRDDPTLDWDEAALAEFLQSARYYKAMLALKPNIATVLRIWLQQRDEVDLWVRGTGDPDLYDQRKKRLDEREASMAALVRQICLIRRGTLRRSQTLALPNKPHSVGQR